MELTKNIVSRDEAFNLAPEFVEFIQLTRFLGRSTEKTEKTYWKLYDKVMEKFNKLKRGQAVITCCKGVWLRCTVSSVRISWQGIDGPVVRVGNGEFTWRVDGSDYAYPI